MSVWASWWLQPQPKRKRTAFTKKKWKMTEYRIEIIEICKNLGTTLSLTHSLTQSLMCLITYSHFQHLLFDIIRSVPNPVNSQYNQQHHHHQFMQEEKAGFKPFNIYPWTRNTREVGNSYSLIYLVTHSVTRSLSHSLPHSLVIGWLYWEEWRIDWKNASYCKFRSEWTHNTQGFTR